MYSLVVRARHYAHYLRLLIEDTVVVVPYDTKNPFVDRRYCDADAYGLNIRNEKILAKSDTYMETRERSKERSQS